MAKSQTAAIITAAGTATPTAGTEKTSTTCFFSKIPSLRKISQFKHRKQEEKKVSVKSLKEITT